MSVGHVEFCHAFQGASPVIMKSQHLITGYCDIHSRRFLKNDSPSFVTNLPRDREMSKREHSKEERVGKSTVKRKEHISLCYPGESRFKRN
jgi:hypothetical protein